jgi:hypothetical protein
MECNGIRGAVGTHLPDNAVTALRLSGRLEGPRLILTATVRPSTELEVIGLGIQRYLYRSTLFSDVFNQAIPQQAGVMLCRSVRPHAIIGYQLIFCALDLIQQTLMRNVVLDKRKVDRLRNPFLNQKIITQVIFEQIKFCG